MLRNPGMTAPYGILPRRQQSCLLGTLRARDRQGPMLTRATLAGLLALSHAAAAPPRGLSPVALEPALQIGQYLPYDDSPCDTWTGLPSSEGEALAPMECGVLWFLHIPKTGGTTIQHHFHDNAAKQGWEFVNMCVALCPTPWP